MTAILKLARIQLIVIMLFMVFKFTRRSLLDLAPPSWVEITLFSLPNLFEGIIGVLLLVGLGLLINARIRKRKRLIEERVIYLIATIVAGIYVFTQELKLHNLGGENVYDVYDLWFSGAGLIVGLLIVLKIRPSVEPKRL